MHLYFLKNYHILRKISLTFHFLRGLPQKISLQLLYNVLYIYPDVANSSEFYSICVDNYATFINNNDDKSILDSICS